MGGSVWEMMAVCPGFVETSPGIFEKFAGELKPKTPQAMTDEDRLNGLEKRFLAYLRSLPNIDRIYIQAINFKLAWDTRYLPDFFTVSTDGKFSAWEVKGFMRDDARVKMHVFARMYPWIQVFLVTHKNGKWQIENVLL